MRAAPLKERKALLEEDRPAVWARENRALHRRGATALHSAVWKLDLEGIVAKQLGESYCPRTKWFKIPNPSYSQKVDRAELFERRYG
jgi:ATP-dependent DNA ligase